MSTNFHKIIRTAAGPLCGILVAAAILVNLATPVMAAEYVLSITQTMDVVGGKTAPTNEVSVSYTLTAENGAPMPKEANGSRYDFSIAGNEQLQLTFHYDAGGAYSYELERTGVSGSGGGMVDGNPRKVKIVNTVDADSNTVTMAVTILDGTYDVGQVVTDCSFDYKCALKLVTGTPAPSDNSANGTGQDGTSGDSGDGSANGDAGGNGNADGSGSGANGPGNGANGPGTAIASNVKTGDETNAVLYLAVMAAALAAVTICVRRGRS